MTKKNVLIPSIIVISVVLSGVYFYGRPLWVPIYQKLVGKRTVADVVERYGADARNRIRPYFKAAGVPYPASAITLLAIKNSALLEVWADTESGARFIRSYPIKALSGTSGPKLREGDGQVPEGFYSIDALNPNSSYHLSMKLNYPNTLDLHHAAMEGRNKPGTNIFIHGKALSVGCLAMGDRAIEEFFVLTVDVGRENIQIAIAPHDPRSQRLIAVSDARWISELYQQLHLFYANYQRHELSGL